MNQRPDPIKDEGIVIHSRIVRLGRMERVKAALRDKPELCALDDLYGNYLANGRNDISTLKRRGWLIESWLVAHQDGPVHKHYRTKRDPEQTTLAFA